MLPAVEGSKDEVKLPRRKRVKEEQDAEEVSTLTSGKVVVSTTGAARIVVAATAEKTAPYKLTAKTRTKRSTTRKDRAVQKNRPTVKSADSGRTAGKKLKKMTQSVDKALTGQEQQLDITRHRLSSLKRSKSQQQQKQPSKKQKLI